MKVTMCTDSELTLEPVIKRRAREVVTYLEADPRHAIVIQGKARQVYVLRGASEELNNFFYGDMPAEDPNDADGGDLTARQAVTEAVKRADEDSKEDGR